MTYEEEFWLMIEDPRYLNNLDTGKPRRGHPEGTLRSHVNELDANLIQLQRRWQVTDENMYWKLKLLIHSHDTFKCDSAKGVPIEHPCSHASLGRAFLAAYCDDDDLLNMAQYHDEPYAIWRSATSHGYNQARFDALINRIKDWDLFLLFQIIDGCTIGKGREPLVWLFDELAGRVETWVKADFILAE